MVHMKLPLSLPRRLYQKQPSEPASSVAPGKNKNGIVRHNHLVYMNEAEIATFNRAIPHKKQRLRQYLTVEVFIICQKSFAIAGTISLMTVRVVLMQRSKFSLSPQGCSV